MEEAKNSLYREILTAISEENFKRALKLVQKYEKAKYPPANSQAARALIESGKGNEEEAITKVREFISTKNCGSILFTTAVDIFRTWGYCNEALKALWDYVLLFPNQFDLIAYCMFNELTFGNFEYAQKRALKMLQIQSCTMHNLFVASTSYFAGCKNNNLSFFKFTISMIEKCEMRLEYTVNMLVDSYNRLGKSEKALLALDDKLNEALKTNAPDIEHTLRRDTLMKLGKKDEALQLIKTYLEQKPNFLPDIHFLFENFDDSELISFFENKTGPGPDTARLLLASKANPQDTSKIISLLLNTEAPFSEIKPFLKPEIFPQLQTISNFEARAYIGAPIQSEIVNPPPEKKKDENNEDDTEKIESSQNSQVSNISENTNPDPSKLQIKDDTSAMIYANSILNQIKYHTNQEDQTTLIKNAIEYCKTCEAANASLVKLALAIHLPAEAVKFWEDRKVKPLSFAEIGEKCLEESILCFDIESLNYFVNAGISYFRNVMMKTYDLVSNSMNGLIFRQVVGASKQYHDYCTSPLRHKCSIFKLFLQMVESFTNTSEFTLSRIKIPLNENIFNDVNIIEISYVLSLLISIKLKKSEDIQQFSDKLKETQNPQWKFFLNYVTDPKEIDSESLKEINFDLFGVFSLIILARMKNDKKLKEIIKGIVESIKQSIILNHPDWNGLSELQLSHVNNMYKTLIDYLKI